MSEPAMSAHAKANAPLPSSAFAVLDDQVILRVTGPMTDQFLHGQFSQSLETVTADHSPRAAACTPKGRAYCLTRFVRDGEDVLLSLPRDLADDIQGRLGKYLMLFRGTSMTAVEGARLVGLLGDGLAHLLAPEWTPGAPGDTVSVGNHRLVRVENCADGLARYEFWQLAPLSDDQAQALDPSSQTPLADWQASELAAGIASLTPQTQEAYVPQMLNWQHVDGIHFKKGCYTGQEVVARMHFLGQLKKSLYRLTLQAEVSPPPGHKIADANRGVGEVVNAIGKQDGSCEVLAVIRHDADFSSLHLEGSDQSLSTLPLPYAVPEREPEQSDT